MMRKKLRSGKGYELTVVGMLVDAGFDVYLPTVDDQAIDGLIRIPTENSRFRYHELQIKGSRTWNGIRCKTAPLARSSILILYCAEKRELLWLLFDDVQREFPLEGAIHGSDWGNVFLKANIVKRLQEGGRGDLTCLMTALAQNENSHAG